MGPSTSPKSIANLVFSIMRNSDSEADEDAPAATMPIAAAPTGLESQPKFLITV